MIRTHFQWTNQGNLWRRRLCLPLPGSCSRARAGDDRALSALFRQQAGALRRWARGRLPQWARGLNDTVDIVQDALLQTFKRIDRFEDRGRGALQAYLRQAVDNRIRDVMRSVARRPVTDLDDVAVEMPARDPSPYDAAADVEQEQRYKRALNELTADEQLLVVARLELDYTYEQVALVANRPTPDAARVAVRRAVTKLAQRMASV